VEHDIVPERGPGEAGGLPPQRLPRLQGDGPTGDSNLPHDEEDAAGPVHVLQQPEPGHLHAPSPLIMDVFFMTFLLIFSSLFGDQIGFKI